MHDSPPTCPSGLPRLGACFAGSSSCCPLLLGHCCWPVKTLPGCGSTATCHRKGGGRPEPIVGPPGLWTCRRVGCRWFHLVEQAANDNARLPPSSAAARAPPTPARVGRPNRLFLAVMPAFLQCYCRLFVNPPEHNTAWPRHPPSRLADRPTHTCVLEPSGSGESCLRAESRRREHVISHCAPDGGPSRRGALAANHPWLSNPRP